LGYLYIVFVFFVKRQDNKFVSSSIVPVVGSGIDKNPDPGKTSQIRNTGIFLSEICHYLYSAIICFRFSVYATVLESILTKEEHQLMASPLKALAS
jgi:hypothetical protein